jgi:hypothetical protein
LGVKNRVQLANSVRNQEAKRIPPDH